MTRRKPLSALEGQPGFIPPRWDQLSLAELEELKHVAHV